MLVVADASPINILVRIECIQVLGQLYRRVAIPPEVLAELSHPQTPRAVHAFLASAPSWLEVRESRHELALPNLDEGEAAAINLARDTSALSILIDDREGRREALRLGLHVIGTLGILEQSAAANLIDLPRAAQRLLDTDFRIDPAMIQAALKRHSQRRGADK